MWGEGPYAAIGALFTCGATAARRAVENPRSFEGNQILEREEGALHSIRLGIDANKLPTKRNQKKVGPDEKMAFRSKVYV